MFLGIIFNRRGYSLNVRCKASPGSPIGTTYYFTVGAVDVGSAVYQEASATTKTFSIPEFPTYALPVVAMLGIMLVLMRKKKKE